MFKKKTSRKPLATMSELKPPKCLMHIGIDVKSPKHMKSLLLPYKLGKNII